VRVVRGELGRVEFRDCLEGLREVEDQSYDLCLTDPPYNINYRGSNFKTHLTPGGHTIGERAWYDDAMPEGQYRDWCREWFGEVQRVSRLQIISPGLRNVAWWLAEYPGAEMLFVLNRCALPGSGVAFLAWTRPWLCWGRFSQAYLSNTIDITSDWGRDRSRIAREGQPLKHPTPKIYELGLKILEPLVQKLGVESVLDPFMGSGWAAEVCEALGVRYLGFELREEYAPDVRLRIARGVRRRRCTLDRFVKVKE